jgi:hypothetical protein
VAVIIRGRSNVWQMNCLAIAHGVSPFSNYFTHTSLINWTTLTPAICDFQLCHEEIYHCSVCLAEFSTHQLPIVSVRSADIFYIHLGFLFRCLHCSSYKGCAINNWHVKYELKMKNYSLIRCMYGTFNYFRYQHEF